jgi:hypothetical protein
VHPTPIDAGSEDILHERTSDWGRMENHAICKGALKLPPVAYAEAAIVEILVTTDFRDPKPMVRRLELISMHFTRTG